MNPAAITSTWLREQSTAKGVLGVAIAAADCAVLADALDIADFAARNCVESYASIEQWESPRLYDLGRVNPRGSVWLDQAVRYLDARGLLERDAGAPNLVRVRDRASEVEASAKEIA
jgi:hypothetical protein